MSDRIDTQILKARISVKIRQMEDQAERSATHKPVMNEDAPTVEEMPDPEYFRKMLGEARK